VIVKEKDSPMAKSEKIHVMISSRCKAQLSYNGKLVLLTEVRKELEKQINSLILWQGQEPLFECWINETSTSANLRQTWWDESIQQSKDADIVIVFYNGEAGGGIKNGPLGICEAELDAVLTDSKKVRVITLPLAAASTDPAQLARDQSYQAFIQNLDLFRPEVKTGEELIERVLREVRAIVVELVQNAALTPDLGKSNIGPALEWHRMSYTERETAMRKQLQKALKEVPGTKSVDSKLAVSERATLWLYLGGKQILTVLHAVPAGLSQSAAREIVGQPFLTDHRLYDQLATGDGGPLHLVACYKGATESQALKMLGFPDATVVPGRFGLHVADSVQKIQIVLLRNCESPTTTSHAVSTWLEWLKRSAEDVEVAKRAIARKRIITAIANENGKGSVVV
jgi:hypothetical protein